MAATHNLQKMTRIMGDFVVKQNGSWNHDQWEELCEQLPALGVKMDDSLREHLGLLLEHLRVFYSCMPTAAKAKAKTKTKTRVKAKAKAKAKMKTGKSTKK